MDTVFDSEQWGWRRSYKNYDVAGMKNSVQLTLVDRKATIRASVPIEFFSYLRDIHPDVTVDRVSLYLDQLATDLWVFGYQIDGHDPVVACDLWVYRKMLPAWVNADIRDAG